MITRNASPTCSQPLFSDISGTVSNSQLANSYSGVGACAASKWASTLNSNAAPTCTQPAFSDISGTLSAGQLPATAATAGSGTNNKVAKFSGASSLVNSSITDDGTTISSAEDVAVNTVSTGSTTKLAYCGGAGAGCDAEAEGTAPTDTTASVERHYPDSTQHVWKSQVNNADFVGDEGVLCSSVTPVNVSTSTTGDQNLMSCSIRAGTLNTTLRILKVRAGILYSTPVASTATVNTKFKLCSVSGCGSGTVITLASFTSSANPGSVTNNSINSQLECTVQTAGASGALECQFGQMLIDLGASPGLADSVFGTANSSTVGTIDLTAATFLQATIAFSAASASNTASQRQGTVEIAN